MKTFFNQNIKTSHHLKNKILTILILTVISHYSNAQIVFNPYIPKFPETNVNASQKILILQLEYQQRGLVEFLAYQNCLQIVSVWQRLIQT